MKRFVCIILVVVLLTCIVPSTVLAAEGDYTRVRVLLSTNATTSMTATTTGSFTLPQLANMTIPAGAHTITQEGGTLSIKIGSTTYDVGSTITFLSSDFKSTSNTTKIYNSHYEATLAYTGNMTFTVSSSKIKAVNEVNIDNYLYGLVPHEMSDTFPVEALKAQAVCGRSYALLYRMQYWDSTTRDYDIGDTSSHQVYKGYNSSHARAIAAVDATAGVCLTYGGKPISTYYSASNGGQTMATKYVWSKVDYSYYQVYDDKYDLENTASLDEMLFISSDGTSSNMNAKHYEYLLDKLRTQLDDETATITAIKSVTPTDNAYAEVRDYANYQIVFSVITQGAPQDVTVTYSFSDLYKSQSGDAEGRVRLGLFDVTYSLRMQGVEAATVNGVTGWYLTNRGWGHGIGMSQRGAQQMASSAYNMSYTEILEFYFPTTKVEVVASAVTPPAATVFYTDVTSAGYTVVGSNQISGVKQDTSVSDLKKLFDSAEYTVSVKNASGSTITSGTLGTGSQISVTQDGKTDTFALVVKGDVDGDGKVNIVDLLKVQRELLLLENLGGAYLTAADVDGSGSTGIVDLLTIQRSLLGLEIIS